MSAKAVKIPGPDHPIAVTKNPKRVTVSVNGKLIASTTGALSLKEASYPAVQYIPRADTDMTALHATAHRTHCPYKGEASYFTIEANGRKADNAVWSYPLPFPAVGEIKEYLAFYPNKVDAVEEV